MNAVECIETLMNETGTTSSELAEYSCVSHKPNMYRLLKQSDMKVSTLVSLIEVMGYHLVVQSEEYDGNEILIDE